MTKAGDYRFFSGWRSDPFFFDVNGNFNHMQFTGDDVFADKNVCSIVIELPNSDLGGKEVGIWARTVDKAGEGWMQAERGGRPMQAVFLLRGEREAYLSGEPADDDRFIGAFGHELVVPRNNPNEISCAVPCGYHRKGDRILGTCKGI